MKQRVYFFLCGTTTDMSLISSRTGSLALAIAVAMPFDECPFVPLEAGRATRPWSSMRRFLDAGSGLEMRPQTCRDIWLKSSI